MAKGIDKNPLLERGHLQEKVSCSPAAEGFSSVEVQFHVFVVKSMSPWTRGTEVSRLIHTQKKPTKRFIRFLERE